MAHVVLISQQPTTSGFICANLQSAGHRVSLATTAGEGHRVLHADAAQVVFIDLNIPECYDLDMIAAWREEFPALKVLSLSWPNTVVDFLALRMMGAHDVLQMPVGVHESLHAVQDALAHDESHDTLAASTVLTMIGALRLISNAGRWP
jgi:DNA-binding NtrC family response regulator